MIRSLLFTTSIIVAIIFSFKSSSAYNGPVHSKINEKVAKEASQLDHTLKMQLGISMGIDNEIDKNGEKKEVWKWIAYGGEAEDFGMGGENDYLRTRAFNHFHDPLEPWIEAGFDNVVNIIYRESYGRDPVSPILWGLAPGMQDFPEVKNTTGDWSWGKAREYYYTYLTGKDFTGNTVAVTQGEREAIFADCFRAVGQVMHMLGDASVPLHTRNDVHVFPLFGLGRWTYETYTKNNIEHLDYNPDQPGDRPNPDLLTDPQPESGYTDLAPVTGLFDRNQYNQGDSIPASGAIIGLAEYSNANFLTNDTMWTYPRPALDDTNYDAAIWLNPETVDAEDGQQDQRIYFRKNTGDPVEHFMVAEYWYYQLHMWNKPELKYALGVDKKCFSDYAAKLIPRAVGYSAALLDYFFRGSIEITLPENGVYALSDMDPDSINPAEQGFDHVSLLARNISDGEEQMEGGTVTLVVKYKVANGNQFQNNPSNPVDEFRYVVKVLPGPISIPRSGAVKLQFDLSDTPIPLWATDVYLYLVYWGKLGEEDGAVAVGFKDISEPTPFLYINVTDQVCLYGQIYDADSTEAINVVDSNGNGEIDCSEDNPEWDVFTHDADDIFIRFSPENNPADASPEFPNLSNNYYHAHLSPGEYLQLFILSDYEFSSSVDYDHLETDDRDNCDSFHGRLYILYGGAAKLKNGVRNQSLLTAPYTRVTSDYYKIQEMDSFFTYFFDNLQYPIDEGCIY